MSWTSLDTWIVAIAVFSAVSCAIPGTFLVLRRMSLMGDAISHAVLPGIAIAFLLTKSRASLPMFVGAALAGLLTAGFSEFVRRHARVEESASLGSVFSILFAIGLIILVRGANVVDLDPNCVLYGSIELTPLYRIGLFGLSIPGAALRTGFLLLFNVALLLIFYKELNLASFDPALATALGFNARTVHYLLMIDTAITTVVVFEMVGSILVIAMLVLPPATALLLTKRLKGVIALGAALAAVAAFVGHGAAITVPRLFGFSDTVTSGSIATVSGLIFAGVLVVRAVVGRADRRNAPSVRGSLVCATRPPCLVADGITAK